MVEHGRLAIASMSHADILSFPSLAEAADTRLRDIVDRHYDFLHRSLRRLGVPDARVEDAAQHVLLVMARRLDAVVPAAERSFLFAVALRTASEVRRHQARLREVHDEVALSERCDPAPRADVALDQARARRVLEDVLDRLPLDLRAVFVLAELEEMTMIKIAELLELPPGTVASRLRRARGVFAAEARTVRLRLAREETP